jgi:hypothetical protein
MTPVYIHPEKALAPINWKRYKKNDFLQKHFLPLRVFIDSGKEVLTCPLP